MVIQSTAGIYPSLTVEEQKPIIKGILFLIQLLQRLELLAAFVDSADFKKEVDEPLENLAKLRDPRGRVARLSAYLKKIQKANRRERHKLIRENAVFPQLINQLKEAVDWSPEDNDRLSYALLAARTEKQKEEKSRSGMALAAVGIGSLLLSAGFWYTARKNPEKDTNEKAES